MDGSNLMQVSANLSNLVQYQEWSLSAHITGPIEQFYCAAKSREFSGEGYV